MQSAVIICSPTKKYYLSSHKKKLKTEKEKKKKKKKVPLTHHQFRPRTSPHFSALFTHIFSSSPFSLQPLDFFSLFS
ncbi:hypothetical protein Pfo_004663, partial [Paulownia fortunei]